MRRAIVLVGVGSVLAAATVGGGVAFAYFTADGSSMGSATTGTGTVLSLEPGTPTAALYPGSTSPVWVTITNPSSADVHVNTLSLDTDNGVGGFAVDSEHSGCPTASLSFAPQSTGWTIPANGSLPIQTASSALAMDLNASNACQGATFSVFVKVG